MTTHHTFTGGLRIVDDRLQINVAGSTWDVSSCPGIQPGDYVIVPAQRLIDPLDASAHTPAFETRRVLFKAWRVRAESSPASPREKGRAERRFTGASLYVPKVDGLSPAAMRLVIHYLLADRNESRLALDQAQLIAGQLMADHEAAGRRLRSLRALLATLRQAGSAPASADPAPASAGSPAPGPTGGAPAPARPTGSPAHSFGPIRLDQTGP